MFYLILVAVVISTINPNTLSSSLWADGEKKELIIFVRNSGKGAIKVLDAGSRFPRTVEPEEYHVVRVLKFSDQPFLIQVKEKGPVDLIPITPKRYSEGEITRASLF